MIKTQTLTTVRPANFNPQAISHLRSLVLDSVTSPQSKRAYARGIDHFLSWVSNHPDRPSGFTKATVQAYRTHLLESGLAPSSINLTLTAVRRLAVEASDNGLMDGALAEGIRRVKGVSREGVRIGNWLTQAQAEELINSPDVSTLKGKRDRALLALMIGSGLRRDEVASLCAEHVQQREGRWVIVDMMGKGKKVRSVPIPSFAKAALDVWLEVAGLDHCAPTHSSSSRIFRPINKGDSIVGSSITAQSVFETVKHYAAQIGLPNLAPHDLRRSFAKLAHKGGSGIDQIRLSLGHSSMVTTERYLGTQQNLSDAPCDHLNLKV